MPAAWRQDAQAVPLTGAQVAAIAGIAAVALGLGYGAASLSGGDEPKKQPSSTKAAGELPAVTPAPKARIAVLGAAPALPAPVRVRTNRPSRTPEPGNGGPAPTPAPTSAPTAAPTSAPTSAPTAAPTPARTPDTGTIG